ncbi:NADH:flavin oxidoreductase [Paenibacillus polymyxa]|uniref:NADH:flavin oxidoreductase n=1 Tax=Paenibacillus polymyxa TaxID=1406 RepID=UPI0004D5C118|nr:NADH:flavin oxidoreductase [Paenibacillus polymyxa]KEO76522.1 1,2-oxophytodienoate reductase [Paenibacillus polymyxa]MCH6190244.1 NADH:flavin oxidoreductase [Paenibacillus polymyxa]WRL60104.1 NADH:flavin oxidoreductase [Paenibacillus polymyxa]
MSNQPQNVHSTEALFQPYTIHNLTLQTRIVMPSMGRAFSPNGVPGPDVAAYYRRRAENDVGLIITEGAVIDHPAGTSEPRIPNFYGEAALNGWAEVVRQVHEAGSKIFPQLWHMGMARPLGSQPNPEALSIGPSGLDLEGNKVTEPMTEEEIVKVIRAYVDAAANAKRLGFDGVEIHGAHGYLVDQFFWERTNQRTDRYGGDIIKRAQFAIELVEAIRAEVGPDYPCSTRRFWVPEFEGSDLSFAGWVKKLTGKTTITVGSVGLDEDFVSYIEGKGAGHQDINELLERLDNNEFDLVAVGRALLGDPAWATKIREGRIHDLQTFTPEVLQTLI